MELRARVDAFVADLSETIRQAALESVRQALGGGASAPAPRGRKPAKAAGRKAPARRAKKGGRVRRSAEDLGQLSTSFLTYVRGNPGQRLEQIGTGMGVDTKELKRPVQLLLADGAIRTEGQRRGTKYFAGGRAKVAKAGRKAGKRKGAKKAA